jgi:hypothetical protein
MRRSAVFLLGCLLFRPLTGAADVKSLVIGLQLEG